MQGAIENITQNYVPNVRNLTAGAGLTAGSGGNLSADRSFAVGANADNSVIVNAHDIQVNVPVVVNFAHVAAALGGAAAGADYTFVSNGSGSGIMKNLKISNRYTVGYNPGDNVDFNSIAAAVNAIIATGNPGTSNPWEVLVYPGMYFEDPFSIPPGIVVKTEDAGFFTTIIANNPNADLITTTGA